MTKIKLQVAHQVPGRIRMKVAPARANPELLEQIKATFSVVPGIEGITVNPATGSVVLHYDADRQDEFQGGLKRQMGGHYRPPTNEIDALADKIQQQAEYMAENSHTARVVVDLFKDVDRQIKTATGNAIDLKIVLAVGIAGLTMFELGAHAATPLWVTFAIFGLNHLIETNLRDADEPGGTVVAA